MNELLALLGLAWPRLLLYPGGLFALMLLWLWNIQRDQRPETQHHLVSMLNSAPPLLAIGLLPLPLAASLGRGIDLVVALALVEWPTVVQLSSYASHRDERRLHQLALGYGLLLPALLALAQATRSFALDAIVARPGTLELLPTLLRLAAVGGWALALLPLLALGPFRAEQPMIGNTMRSVGHILLATLPILPLLGGWWWLAPLPALSLGLLLRATHRWAAPNSPRWLISLRAASALLWVLLAWAALDALLARAL